MDSVVLETNLGDVQLELYWDHAPRVSHHTQLLIQSVTDPSHSPQTCKNFAELAKRGYYNGVVFHRVIAVCLILIRQTDSNTIHEQDFMIQGGDPTGTGRGGTSIYGQKLYFLVIPVYLLFR